MSQLADGLQDLSVALLPAAVADLELFLLELERWNRVHNLTAITEENASISLHLLDSIAILPGMLVALEAQAGSTSQTSTQPYRIADLGSGGGLPAIPLAIARPDWRFSLIEKVRKKTAFLQHLKGRLHLNNVEILTMRVEDAGAKFAGEFDAVISRAFTNLADFLRLAEPFLKPTGVVFAMKAKHVEAEISSLPQERWRLVADLPVHLPNCTVERHLLTFTQLH